MTQSEEAEALLKILELGERQVAEGKLHNAADVIADLRRKYAKRPDRALLGRGFNSER